ncbi:platelet endothelial cell adhesion molecule isoform 3-T4 [Pholidichthys leucotaenia]
MSRLALRSPLTSRRSSSSFTHRMDLLLLLLVSPLLSSYFHGGSVVNGQQHTFIIRSVNLSVKPSSDVRRDTNVTLRCQAVISSTGQEVLTREYTLYKDESVVYTKKTSSSEDFVFPLPGARVSNNGRYKCKIKIKNQNMMSDSKKLKVTGLADPVLTLSKLNVQEGEEVTAWCSAPGETGSIYFHFYDNSNESHVERVNSNQAEAKFSFSSSGSHQVHCSYTVLITADSIKSKQSNMVTVTVRELNVTPDLEVSPHSKIFEGDPLTVWCTVQNSSLGPENIDLYLSQGSKLLKQGNTSVNHSMVAQAESPDGLTFECRMAMGNIMKDVTKTVPVSELFSAPTLTISPAEVFQREPMALTCRSETFAPERIRREDITYTIDPQPQQTSEVFKMRAPFIDLNYTCKAQAKGIEKHSRTLMVRPKVDVSVPKISVDGRVIVKQPFYIHCQSDVGSLPINYTLYRDYEPVHTISVQRPDQKALFSATVYQPEEIYRYMCEASNNHKTSQQSRRLGAAVIEPVTIPTLMVVPELTQLKEGDDVYLICRVNGTPPITFKWYHDDKTSPFNTSTTNRNAIDYRVPLLSSEHGGTYYCEASNHANKITKSNKVLIVVRMAQWKKAVIGGTCLMMASMLLLVACVLYFRSKRVKVEGASDSIWSERKPEAANEESSVASTDPDVEYTEVVHPRSADPAKAPLKKGTDTVYSELQNSPQGAADHHDIGLVEYAELNGEHPDVNQYHPHIDHHQDLPEPVE